jgi:hypothetical protein
VPQFGRLGCKRAHDRLVIAGCAGPVIGEIEDTADGNVLESPGCRMGETNALGGVSKPALEKKKPLEQLTASGDPQ